MKVAEHGYVLEHGEFTTIDVPGAIFTFVGGNNPANDLVGTYFDSSGIGHAFSFRRGEFSTIDFPNAFDTEGNGIGPDGTIVGLYVDTSGGVHGFIRTP